MNIRRQRPTSVLVIAILSLLFGFSFGLQGCMGKGMTFFWAGFEKHLPPQMQPPDPNNPNAPQAPAPGADPMMLAQLKLIREDPSFLPITTTFFVTFMLAGLLQCVAGVGLIMMKHWGRVLAILVALVILVTTVGNVAYELIVLAPVEAAMADIVPAMIFNMKTMPQMTNFFRVAGPLPQLVLVAATIYYLTRKDIKAAFTAPLEQAAADAKVAALDQPPAPATPQTGMPRPVTLAEPDERFTS